jgi:hypothetical protein
VAGNTWGWHGCDRMAHILKALVWTTHTRMHQVSFSGIKSLFSTSRGLFVRRKYCNIFSRVASSFTMETLETSWRPLPSLCIGNILELWSVYVCMYTCNCLLSTECIIPPKAEIVYHQPTCKSVPCIWSVKATFNKCITCFIAPDATSLESSTDSIYILLIFSLVSCFKISAFCLAICPNFYDTEKYFSCH